MGHAQLRSLTMARTKSGRAVLTPVERAAKSLDELIAKGGRRFNLKLSPEANAAINTILEIDKYDDITHAINETLIRRSKQLKAQSDGKNEE